MRTYKEVTTTKTVTEKIAVGYKCDCCGKDEDPRRTRKSRRSGSIC